MGAMYGRWLCPLSLFFSTTCPNNVFCLTQGRFPGGSASIAKWTWRQSCTVEELWRYNFYLFFSVFLHAQKRTAGVDLQCWTGGLVEQVSVNAYLAPSIITWPSKANRYLRWIDCSRMHAPPAFFARTCLRSRNDLRQFNLLEICSQCKHHSAISRAFLSFFFFFFFFFVNVDRTTNRVQTPSLPYESSFVCPRCVNFWDDP